MGVLEPGGVAISWLATSQTLRVLLRKVWQKTRRMTHGSFHPPFRFFVESAMPLMHAEDREVARLSVETFAALSEAIEAAAREGLPDPLEHAEQHAAIVARFGRYPHRNALLGRASTDEERVFLADGGPTFGQRPRP